MIAVVEYMWAEDVEQILTETGGQVDTSLLPSDMLARMNQSVNMSGPDFIMKGPRAEDVDNRFRSGA